MAEVVKREADARVSHSKVLINFVKEHGHQSRLPIVAMNDVRMFVRFEHELERRAAKESEALDIVVVAVKDSAIEEVMMGVRIDEKTFQAFHESEIDVAMNPLVVVRNPKVGEGFRQTPDAVVTQAIVFGEDDFDRITTNPELSRETLDDVAEAADFCGGSALGCDHYDEHGARKIR